MAYDPTGRVSSLSLCGFPTPVRLYAWLWMRRPYGESIRVAVMWSGAISLEAVIPVYDPTKKHCFVFEHTKGPRDFHLPRSAYEPTVEL